MALRRAAPLLLLVACSHGEDDALTPPSFVDAQPAPDAARCSPGSPLATFEPVAGVNDPSADEDSPWLSDDQLTIWFSSDRDGDADIYVATRANRFTEFDPPAPVDALNSPGQEGSICLSADGETAYLHSDRAGDDDVYVASRDGDTFTTPVRLDDPVSTGAAERSPCATGDSLYLERRTGGDPGLVRATRGAAGFDQITTLPELTGGGSPRPTRDDRGLFFSSAALPGNVGGRDMYFAARDEASGPYTDVFLLFELNIGGDDEPGWVSPDGCDFYWTVDNPPGSSRDLWTAQRL